MASFANHVSLFILLALLLSLQIHARDVQFFNKVSTNNVVPNNNQPQNNQEQEPNFLPQNENTYGLYSHDSTQLPPSATGATTTTTTPSKHYRPKNYNPVAYVTEPEDTSEKDTFTEERSFNSNPEINNNYYPEISNSYYNGEQNYYNNQQEQETEFRKYRHTNRNRNNYYYNGGSSFNSDPQGFAGERYRDGGATLSSREKYLNNGGFQPQGMSDTRLLENGKYFYDVNNEKYSSNHPYERLKGARARNNEYNNKNYYENNENSYEFNGENTIGGYQNEEEFEEEQNYNLP